MSDASEQEAPAGGDARSPEEIRAEIEQTREQLGETVEALAEKTDVKARTQEQIGAAKETVVENLSTARETVTQKADELASKVREATPESAAAGFQQASAVVQARPLPYATLAAFAAGLFVGWLIGRR